MRYVIDKAVRVDRTIYGLTVTDELEPGTHDLDPAIAELLVAQGHATLAKSEPRKPKDEVQN